jgi:hypothetical protein
MSAMRKSPFGIKQMTQKRFKKRRPYVREENPHKIFRKMTTDHVDVLQNIEFILVEAYREHEEVDDRVVASALKAVINNHLPEDETVRMIFNQLYAMRIQRSDVSDEIWTKGLKVVLESVHTHSDNEPGDTDYLDFAAKYIP